MSVIKRVPVHGKKRHITFDLISCLLQKGKTRSPVRTELPKIGPPAPVPQLPVSPTTNKESNPLLNRVAAALPLLPPLPKDGIDQTKGKSRCAIFLSKLKKI